MVVHRSPKPTVQVRFLVDPPKVKPLFRAVLLLALFLRLFEGDALAQRRVELGELDLAGSGLLVLARPNNVRRLCRLKLYKANL